MYDTDITLGEKYIDKQTGIEGVAIAVTHFQHGCERVTLELVVEGKIEEYTFDAPRLTHVATGKTARETDTGGPMRGSSHIKHPGSARGGARR